MEPRIAPFRAELTADGAAGASFVDVSAAAELAPGTMRRVSFGERDVLFAHTTDGLVAVDDRCPHMSAPLSLGELDGCVVSCPLHEGRFDFRSGEPVRMPTTGGLDPAGRYHPTWTPEGREARPEPPGRKAEARHYTRVRRFRYYPLRIVDGRIEIALPS